VEAQFGPFGDIANLNSRLVHGLRRMFHWLRNCLTHPMALLGDVGHVEPYFGLIGDRVSISASTVCAKCTIGSEIILDAPDGTHR
jgi:hypothetical protein